MITDEFEAFEKLSEIRKPPTISSRKPTCKHLKTLTENGIEVCYDCGEELTKNILFDKEWRYYGASDSKHTSDPNRCQARKTDEKTIFRDVENMGFADKIVNLANEIYIDVTKNIDTGDNKIFRGNSRKGIIFACIYHAYKLNGTPQTEINLMNVFNINKKIALKGLKHVSRNAPKNSPVRTTYVTPIDLVNEIMDKFSASNEQKAEVIEIYNKINNKSSRIERARPQSIASGLTYYWICKKEKDISIKDFVAKVNLSELTVNKIVKEITDILENDEN